MKKEETHSDLDSLQDGSLPEGIKEELKNLPEEEREKIVIAIKQSYCGPVMTPQLLGQIEEIIPGGANRVLQLSEKEQVHRHRIVEIETKTEAWQVKASLLGGLGAFILLLFGILFCSIYGYTSGIVAFGGIGAFGVVSRIVNLPNIGRKNRN